MIPIVYRWDDANAPVARGERRSLVDILRACLVDGYGTKAAAGWTLEYINATFDRAAFKNNPISGTGFFLQVDGLSTANAYTHNLQGFEEMTSDSVGILPFNTGTARYTMTSNAAGTTARPWVVIADDRGFYLFIWNTVTALTDSTTAVLSSFFGDFRARLPDDAYACGLYTSNSASWLGYMTTADGNINQYILFVPRLENAVAGGGQTWAVNGGGPLAMYAGKNGMPYSAGGPIYISQPSINNGVQNSFRGFLPGYYYPCHSAAFGQLQEVASDSKSFLSIRHYIIATSIIGNSFILLDDWWL